MILLASAWATCLDGVWTFGGDSGSVRLEVDGDRMSWALGQEVRAFAFTCEGAACIARPALWGEGEQTADGGYLWRFPTGETAVARPGGCGGGAQVEVAIQGDPALVDLVGSGVWRGRNVPAADAPLWRVELVGLELHRSAAGGLIRTRGRVTVVASRLAGPTVVEVGRTRIEADDDGDMGYLLGTNPRRTERFVRRRLAERALAWLEGVEGLVPARVLERSGLAGAGLAEGSGVRAGERFLVQRGEEVVAVARAYAPEQVSFERVLRGGPAEGDALLLTNRRYGYLHLEAGVRGAEGGTPSAEGGTPSAEGGPLDLGAGVGWQWTLGPGRQLAAFRVGLLPGAPTRLELGFETAWVAGLGRVQAGPLVGAGMIGSGGGYAAAGALVAWPFSRGLSLELRGGAVMDDAGVAPSLLLGLSSL